MATPTLPLAILGASTLAVLVFGRAKTPVTPNGTTNGTNGTGTKNGTNGTNGTKNGTNGTTKNGTNGTKTNGQNGTRPPIYIYCPTECFLEDRAQNEYRRLPANTTFQVLGDAGAEWVEVQTVTAVPKVPAGTHGWVQSADTLPVPAGGIPEPVGRATGIYVYCPSGCFLEDQAQNEYHRLPAGSTLEVLGAWDPNAEWVEVQTVAYSPAAPTVPAGTRGFVQRADVTAAIVCGRDCVLYDQASETSLQRQLLPDTIVRVVPETTPQGWVAVEADAPDRPIRPGYMKASLFPTLPPAMTARFAGPWARGWR